MFKKKSKNSSQKNIRKRPDKDDSSSDESSQGGKETMIGLKSPYNSVGVSGDVSGGVVQKKPLKLARISSSSDTVVSGVNSSNDFAFKGDLLKKDNDLFAIEKEDSSTKKNLDSKDDDSEIYRGKEAYKKFYEKRDSGTLKKSGPIRGPSNVRSTTFFDYAPDICKDYKETGFCGYGDSCKFMHDRGDYKFGWQIDKEWESKKSLSSNDPNRFLIESENEDDDGEDDDEDNLPFACFICRGPFVDPIVTRCGHYFCEKCALKQYSKSSKCFVCNQITNGQFNVAKDLVKRLQEKQAKLVEIRKQEESELLD